MVKAGDEVMFATDEDVDRINWIYKLYTATGQSFKPALPSKMGGAALGTDQTLQKVKGGMYNLYKPGTESYKMQKSCIMFIVNIHKTH